MEKVRVKIQNETASGRREGWTKLVTGVDTTITNGYAFAGDFLRDGAEHDLPVGAILVQCNPQGSVKNGWKSGVCLRVQADGSLLRLHNKDYDWRDDFLSFRDLVADELTTTDEPDLDTLRAERERLTARIDEIDAIIANRG